MSASCRYGGDIIDVARVKSEAFRSVKSCWGNLMKSEEVLEHDSNVTGYSTWSREVAFEASKL